jgi:hypothetical protein
MTAGGATLVDPADEGVPRAEAIGRVVKQGNLRAGPVQGSARLVRLVVTTSERSVLFGGVSEADAPPG